MRLFEHADFDQAIIRAAEHFRDRGLRPAIIEKDYYVTEALRLIATVAGDKVIFKGGTSLSKGWNLTWTCSSPTSTQRSSKTTTGSAGRISPRATSSQGA